MQSGYECILDLLGQAGAQPLIEEGCTGDRQFWAPPPLTDAIDVKVPPVGIGAGGPTMYVLVP